MRMNGKGAPDIHNSGAKAPRDRARIGEKYSELCTFMRVRPVPAEELAKLTNEQFYRLCEDTYNRQPRRKKLDYSEAIGATPKRKPLAFKWFLADLLLIRRAEGFRRLVTIIEAPFRYPGFLRRKRRSMAAAKKAEQEIAAAAATKPPEAPAGAAPRPPLPFPKKPQGSK